MRRRGTTWVAPLMMEDHTEEAIAADRRAIALRPESAGACTLAVAERGSSSTMWRLAN